jgi:hypothetical protein
VGTRGDAEHRIPIGHEHQRLGDLGRRATHRFRGLRHGGRGGFEALDLHFEAEALRGVDYLFSH